MDDEVRNWILMLSFSHYMIGLLYLILPYFYWWSGMLIFFQGIFGSFGALNYSRPWARMYVFFSILQLALRFYEITSDFPDDKDSVGNGSVAFAILLNVCNEPSC
eukprot:TRINITY_DN1156_c0_g1_i1.p1 TRINITY_DN1156_c0_g1~~TRINITY_DN1156_c0_g1_i1.p1  ORF type:complete len:105 (+),score=14.68 TRINITY_DN1156_c0_g1_i1:76-390(+)